MSLPRETTPSAEARALLAQLELLSHGATQRIAHTTGGSTDHVVPPGEPNPPHVHLRAAWLAAESEDRRAQVVGWMRDALDEAHGVGLDRSHVVEESAEELQARIVAEGAGLQAGEASVMFRCTVTMVRRARLALGYEPEEGRPTPEVQARLDAEREARDEVLRLAGNGMSVRAIAMATGVPRSTVGDWINRGKAA